MLHTPTSQPLFIRRKTAAELFEKEAAAIARMPDDDKRWPAQVLSELHKQLPFMSKYDVDIEMTRIEPEAGYALGYAMLRNKTGRTRAEEQLGKATNKLRVPVIVADRLLQPFHVFEIGGKTYPLTQDRVESAMMNPAMFDGASDPPGTQSLLDQIYPPFQHRQGYGMMSGDRATVGLSKLSSAPAKTAGIMGMTYDPGNANVQALQKQYGGNWKNALAQQRGMNPASIQPVKTASGELGPLRGFLRQAEIEKQAANLIRQGLQQAGRNIISGAGRRGAGAVVGAVKPPTLPHAPTPGAVGGLMPVSVTTRAAAHGPSLSGAGATPVKAVAPPPAAPAKAVAPPHPGPPAQAVATNEQMAQAYAGRHVEAVPSAPASAAGGGRPVEIRPRQPDILDQLTARRRAAAGTSGPAPAVSTPVARDPAQVLAERRAIGQRIEAANVDTTPAAAPSAPAARLSPSAEYNAPTFADRLPRLGRSAEAAPFPRGSTPPSRSFTARRGSLRNKVNSMRGPSPGSAAEINLSGAAGNAPPALDPSAHSFAMREMGLPANTSPEQFALFTAQAEQASARLGRQVTPQEMYRHSIAGTSAGYMDSAARAAGGGLRGLGYGIAAGGIGLGLGGMAIANKAQDNY